MAGLNPAFVYTLRVPPNTQAQVPQEVAQWGIKL
jgi:hypothetical protein